MYNYNVYSKKAVYNSIKAFRQRLIRAQFSDVQILCLWFRNGWDACFLVKCKDIDGNLIERNMSIDKIRNTPRLVWFD